MPKYRTTLRPAIFGGVPIGVKWEYVEVPPDLIAGDKPVSRHRYGVIETDRELTAAELDHFDIVEVP